jgi:hypothetical protein
MGLPKNWTLVGQTNEEDKISEKEATDDKGRTHGVEVGAQAVPEAICRRPGLSPLRGSGSGRSKAITEQQSMRVDRLRLLGNGVVPQQAKKAFRKLMMLFNS